MKGKKHINKKYLLVYLSVFLLLFSFSCGLSEFGEVKHVNFKAHPKVVVPIAYGTIDLTSLVYYMAGTDSVQYPPDEDGYYSFPQIFTEISIPDTFAFDGTLFEKLSEVELRIETNNHLPLGIDLELNFVDTLTFLKYGNPVKCPFLKPAVIDKDGRAIEAYHHVETTIVPDSQFLLYQKANAIIMMVNLYLPESEMNTIQLCANDFLSLNIGLAIQITTGD